MQFLISISKYITRLYAVMYNFFESSFFLKSSMNNCNKKKTLEVFTGTLRGYNTFHCLHSFLIYIISIYYARIFYKSKIEKISYNFNIVIYIQAPIIPEILAFHRINIFLKSLVFFFLIISNERMIFYSGMHILPL